MTAKSIYSKLNGLRPQAKPAQRARPVASVLALLAEAGIHLLLGAVLAGAVLFESCAPLGTAFVGAAGSGLYGGAALVGACLVPVLKILVITGTIKLGAAVTGIVSDKRISACADRVGKGCLLLLRCVCTATALFIIVVAVVSYTVSSWGRALYALRQGKGWAGYDFSNQGYLHFYDNCTDNPLFCARRFLYEICKGTGGDYDDP